MHHSKKRYPYHLPPSLTFRDREIYFQELTQIEDMLMQQRGFAEFGEIRKMIYEYLMSLQRPIQRIGY
jgi:hypothetical protein